MAAGRLYLPRGASTRQLAIAMVAFCLISMSPDADVLGFSLGVAYGDPLGHRGATHSFAFALVLGLAALGLAKWVKQPPRALALAVGLTALSHGLLDTLTNGGLGCALLWPLSDERFFAPFRPLPVAPIGLGMLSLRGGLVLLVELVCFLPFVIYATAPRRAAGR
jgi:inner membrane protein